MKFKMRISFWESAFRVSVHTHQVISDCSQIEFLTFNVAQFVALLITPLKTVGIADIGVGI